MPDVQDGESRDEFVERCVPIVLEDDTAEDREQAVAICSEMWRNRDKTMDPNQLLVKAIRERADDRAPICTADWYVRPMLEACGDGLIKATFGYSAKSILKEAENQLVFSHPEFVTYKQTTNATEFQKLLPDGIAVPKNTALLDFHIVTTPSEDRDKDVLRSEGGRIDPKLPTLWQHMQHVVLGKMLVVVEQSKNGIKLVSALLTGNELRDDAILLTESEALRWSHGFIAEEFEERKNKGFNVTGWEMLEESKVAVPSNRDARTELISAFSGGKLKTDYWKAIAKHYYDERPAQMSAPTQLKLKLGGAEIEVTTHDTSSSSASVSDYSVTPSNQEEQPTFKTVKGCKNFNPDMEHLEASKLEYDWAAKFLGCQIKELVVTGTAIRSVYAGSFFYGEQSIQQDGWQKADQRNLTYDGKEFPLRHEVIELNSERSGTFMIDGIEFWKLPNNKRLVIKHRETWFGYEEVIYSKDETGNEHMSKCWDWVRENNFLKGEAFSLTGSFIKRKGQELDDVFLEPKNKQAVSRAIRIMNDKQDKMKSRGMILSGPPGTGKTLSCRVLLNQCNSTFIWISAKDFWRTGAVGGICSALDLAAELAPSVVCLEDVDNWIAGHSTDLLKTEMDGLDQKDGVLTVLSTNFPEKLPDALIDRPGRFHDVLEFDLPNEKIRLQMLQAWTSGVEEKELAEIAAKTQGYSGAHMFELCQFAETLKDEDDQLDMKSALDGAIEKIDEQRELITQQQLAGSTYRPSRREFDSYCKEAGRKDVSHEEYIELMDILMPLRINPIHTKAGRVLADKHVKKLKAVRDDIEEMNGMDKLPKAAGAMCERCIRNLDEVIKAAEKPMKPEGDDKPKPDEEKPKQVLLERDHEFTAQDAAALLLVSDDEELLRRTIKGLHAALEIKNLDQLATECRELEKSFT